MLWLSIKQSIFLASLANCQYIFHLSICVASEEGTNNLWTDGQTESETDRQLNLRHRRIWRNIKIEHVRNVCVGWHRWHRGKTAKTIGGKIVFLQKSLNLAFRSESPKHFGWHMFLFDISRNILHVLFSCFLACFINKRCTICGWWVRVKDKYEILKATEPSVDYMWELCVGSVWASFSFSSVSAQ